MISRNEPMGTVERTRKNLVYMRNARKAGADIHEVTHLLNSLLGLIVVPWERLQDCGVSRLKPSLVHVNLLHHPTSNTAYNLLRGPSRRVNRRCLVSDPIDQAEGA